MNAVAKFKLHFDKEELIFRDGEYITGFLELTLNEDLKYKAISFELKGYSMISWEGLIGTSSSSSQDPPSPDVYREHCSEKCIMLGKFGNFLDKDPILQAGEHVLPFEVRVPKEVPSSFEGQYGRIRYEARGVVERPSTGFKTHKDIYGRTDLVVLAALDLNTIPEAFFKIEICKYKELGLCCTEGSLTIDWVVDKSGFIPTEEIAINGSIQNDSKRPVASSNVSLIMVVEYRLKKKRLIDRVRIANLEKGGIMTDDVTVWNDRLLVPSCPPSSLGRSKTVDISYELEFKVTLEDGHISPIAYTKTVYVGTVVLTRQTTTPPKPQFLTAYPPALVASETTLLVPCYAQMPRSAAGVVLTSPLRSNDVAGFSGNGKKAGSDAFSRGDGDNDIIPLEDRPPPYAPGHNPDDFDFCFEDVEGFPQGALDGEPGMAIPLTGDEPDSDSFSKTLSIRGDVSEDRGIGSDTSPVDPQNTASEDVDDDNLISACSDAIAENDWRSEGVSHRRHHDQEGVGLCTSSTAGQLTLDGGDGDGGMVEALGKEDEESGSPEGKGKKMMNVDDAATSRPKRSFNNSPDRSQEGVEESPSRETSAQGYGWPIAEGAKV